MTDRPILFSGPMVRGLLAGDKTQTRRVIATRSSARRPNIFDGTWSDSYVLDPGNAGWRERAYPWRIGDRLWVREMVACGECAKGPPSHWAPSFWRREQGTPANRNGIWYQADGLVPERSICGPGRWYPAMHMPRWCSRLTLPVAEVRVQRLQDITEADAIAEGMQLIDKDVGGAVVIDGVLTPRAVERRQCWTFDPADEDVWESSAVAAYRILWNRLNAKRGFGWETNPWVVAITFTVEHRNIDLVARAA